MNYEQAMNEISVHELKHMPMYQRIQQQLLEKHDAEKEGGGNIAFYSKQPYTYTKIHINFLICAFLDILDEFYSYPCLLYYKGSFS